MMPFIQIEHSDHGVWTFIHFTSDGGIYRSPTELGSLIIRGEDQRLLHRWRLLK